MVDKNRRNRDRMRRMDEMVIRDQYRWLSHGFLKVHNSRSIDRVDSEYNFYGAETKAIQIVDIVEQ